MIVHDAYALRPNKVETFKQEASRIDLIESSTIASYVPVQIQNAGRGDRTFWKTGSEPTAENLVNIQLGTVTIWAYRSEANGLPTLPLAPKKVTVPLAFFQLSF